MEDPIVSVCPIECICCTFKRGSGTEDDPVRQVKRYYNNRGKLLAEHDPHLFGNFTIYKELNWAPVDSEGGAA